MLDSTRESFDTLAKVLLRCWILGVVFLLIWFGAMASGVVHKIHGPMMGLSDHELDVIHYCGMALFKLLVILLFFIPWLSIKLVIKREKQ